MTKVGRKWISASYIYERGTYGKLRVDRETLRAESGGYHIGRCYFTQREHDEEMLLNLAWKNFADVVRSAYPVPKNVTLDQIQTAAKVLGINLKLETLEKKDE